MKRRRYEKNLSNGKNRIKSNEIDPNYPLSTNRNQTKTGYEIPEIKALKKMNRFDEAEALLKKLADQVLPIMYKRKWKVKRLYEFFPKDNRLLGMNVNMGGKILIRLRPPGRTNSFYPYNHLLGTMLHELVHMEIGPHNTNFYSLLNNLRQETEELMIQGLSGSMGALFSGAGKGQILGGQKPLRNESNNLRQLMSLAAEKRKHYESSLLGSQTSYRLGGENISKEFIKEKMLQAAEKRRRQADAELCHAIVDGINLTQDDDKEIIVIEDEDDQKQWICQICTLVNSIQYNICQACGYSNNSTNLTSVEIIDLCE